MKRYFPLYTALAFAVTVIASGCTTESSTQIGEDTTAVADTANHTLSLGGDFDGPLGLQLYSIRDAMQEDVPGTLEWVRSMGFEEVELAGTYGLSPEQFKQELDSAGIRATSMHTGYERFRDSLEIVLDEAELFGVDHVGIAWIPHEGTFTVEQARQTASDFNEFGRAAAERGLTFFYHNHGYEFQPADDGTVPFDVLVQETNPEDVKYQMDVFWTHHPGVDAAELLRRYPDRWVSMHIKDMREGTPTGDFSGGAPAETKVPVGSGQIDWTEVLQAAQEVGIERYYIEDESTDPMGNIPQSIDYLEQITFAGE